MEKSLRSKLITFAICIIAAFSFMLAGCSLPSGNGDVAPPKTNSKWLKDIYKDYFRIGAATAPYFLERYDDVFSHFNSLTAENDMKWRVLEPKQGEYNYANADKLVEFAKSHEAGVRGHCLLWYKSLPQWLANMELSRTSALDIIDNHVRKTMEYFGNDIYAWDVVNEALHNTVTANDIANGTFYRTGGSEFNGSGTVDWYEICGEDFIKQTFKSADQTRKQLGLNTELYYNDYGLNDPNKREACVQLVKMLQESNIAIDGVGMQAHYRLPRYTANKEGFLKNFEDSIKAFTKLGVDVQITELDICVYGNDSEAQAFDSLPQEVESEQAEMFGKLFEICRRYTTPWGNGYGRVTGITTWGVADDHTPHTNSTHKEYPLIFSDERTEKMAYYEIVSF